MGLLTGAQRTACVDLDKHQYTEAIGKHLNHIATHTGADIFVLRPHESKAEAAGDPEVDASQGTRLKIKIYGDHESVEHAKFRVLILIDDLVRYHSLHSAQLLLTHGFQPAWTKSSFAIY